MRILIIRHGDPDYAIDGLTDKGKREVALLADRLELENITAVYCSTYGRAMRTAEPTLERIGLEAEYCEWLREFNYEKIHVPYQEKEKISWDLLPEYVEGFENIYHPTLWRETDHFKGTGVLEAYDNVCENFDALIAKHGYERDGYSYRAVRPNHDTIALFCHYGVSAILLAHIMHCSPYSPWQHTIIAPTGVTTVCTEERVEGRASLRVSAIGDTSHLYAGGESPAFSGRFCECFTDSEDRH